MISKHVGELVAAAVDGRQLEWCWAATKLPQKFFPWYGKISDLEDPKKIFRIANETENRVRFRLALMYRDKGFQIQAVNGAAEAALLTRDAAFVEWFSDWSSEDVPESKVKP